MVKKLTSTSHVAAPPPKLAAQLEVLASADPDNFARIDPDPIPDDIHATCDAEIFEQDSRNRRPMLVRPPEDSVNCAYLLSQLTKSPSASNYLNTSITIDELLNILSSLDPAAEDAILEACRLVLAQGTSASFRELRRFKCLIQPKVWKKTMDPAAATADEGRFTVELQATQLAWRAPAFGEYHRVLHAAIEGMVDQNAYYGNFLPVIQSSGMGKSRTVHELATLFFSLPLNVHPPLKPGDIVYPLPDSAIREYLTTLPELAPPAAVKFRYAAFFHALFTVAARYVDDMNQGHVYGDLPQVARAWRDHLEQGITQGQRTLTMRDKLYADVVQEATISLPTMTLEEIIQAKSLWKLTHAVCQRAGCKDPPAVVVVVPLDEASTLSAIKLGRGTEDDVQHHTAYDSFWSAFVDLTPSGSAFGLSLSTNSHLSAHAPPQQHSSSSRALQKDAKHHAPYTELPFDCFRSGSHIFKPGKHTLEDVASVGFMCKFGRPLFSTRWEQSEEESAVRKGMLDFAFSKLMRHTPKGLTDKLVTGSSLSKAATLAPLALRILLEFDITHGPGREMEEELVESHMRIARWVPKHRLFMRTSYCSEPLLAVAAAKAMSLMAAANRYHPFDLIAAELGSGLINKGARGELFARLLLTLAFDRAARQSLPAPKSTEPSTVDWSQPVPVIAFLKALFSTEVADEILKYSPDGRSAPNLRQSFENGYVRFSHFISMARSRSVDTHLGLAGAARGFAIQAAFQQEIFDIAIPVVMTKGKLRERDITFILVQVKNRVESAQVKLDVDKFPGFFSGENTHPYISICLELGVDRTSRNKYVESNTSAPTSEKSLRSAPSQLAKKNPAYCFTVYSAGMRTYGVIESTHQEDKTDFILGLNTMKSEYARNDLQATADKVHRLKHEWERDEKYFDWIDDKELCDLTPEPKKAKH